MRLPLPLLSTILTGTLCAQITTHRQPFGPGQAVASNKYEVFVSHGSAPEQKLDVVMSIADPRGDYAATELLGRTFSFASIDYNLDGAPLNFRVVKKFGTPSTAAAIAPRSYGFQPTLTGENEVRFSVNTNNRTFSVHFKGADNETAKQKWIAHMLCIFIDPPETDKPNRAEKGVLVFNPKTTPAELSAASTIFFPAGHHNLRAFASGAPIVDGTLTLKSNQSVYLEGGTFVEGLITTESSADKNQRIFGRGILSGRQYPRTGKTFNGGRAYRQIVRLGHEAISVDGVTLMESPTHGIVAGSTKISNVKLIGWHCNNDGFRVDSGSEIKNCFIRAADDHFYNFNIWVHDCVLWAGHNGAILTYGWGGSKSYDSGASLLENIDIIHPEWMSLGNNNSLVATQTALAFKPKSYNGKTTTILRNIRIEGTIPGLVNIKPRSEADGLVIATKVPLEKVGFLGDTLFESITVDAQSGQSRIKGTTDAAIEGKATYFVQEIRFKNIKIGSKWITPENASKYFEIDPATTRDITFSVSDKK